MNKLTVIFVLLTSTILGSISVSANEVLVGDVNADGVVNVRDAAFIAADLAKDSTDELDAEVADYNSDKLINVRDCAGIAKNLAKSNPVPKKTDYLDINDYVNDAVKYKAYMEYGIINVSVADNMSEEDLQQCSWDVPVEFIPDPDSVDMLPMSYVTTADEVIESLMANLSCMVDEQRIDLSFKELSDDEIEQMLGEDNAFTLYW